MSKSKMRRISSEMDRYLEGLAGNLSRELGRPVSITEASRILAAQQNQTPYIIKKRGKRKPLSLGSFIRL